MLHNPNTSHKTGTHGPACFFKPAETWQKVDGVQCGWLTIDAVTEQDDQLAPLLSTAEKVRWRQYHFPRDARRYLVRTAWRRAILGRELKTAPVELEIRFGPWAKPELAGRELHFNSSHTNGLAVLALHPTHMVGVDAERNERGQNSDELAANVLHPAERDALYTLDKQARPLQFIRLWTGKEALLKAIGFGLSIDPASIALHIDGDHIEPSILPPALQRPWRMRFFQPISNVTACLARAND